MSSSKWQGLGITNKCNIQKLASQLEPPVYVSKIVKHHHHLQGGAGDHPGQGGEERITRGSSSIVAKHTLAALLILLESAWNRFWSSIDDEQIVSSG